ncbi:MAG: glycoside hydrolase family 3 N-terminal domain-containing protein [Planctomycetota bacterium]
MIRISVLVLFAAISTSAPANPAYRDASRSVDERVEDLLARMTLDEKVAQLACLQEEKAELRIPTGGVDIDVARRVMPHGIGQIARPSHRVGPGFVPGVDPNLGARETVRFVNGLQRFAVEETRLGIPILFHAEGLHGYQALNATSFPTPIALASAWDPKLVEEVYTVVAREMRARGVHLALTPVLDVARDPRWGRLEETPGEDPFLVSRFGVAAVRGFQGRELPLARGRVLATLKHFAAHGQPVGGTNIAPGLFSERMLRETFLPPFEAAVREANAQCVMVTYNEIDGVPCVANDWLLRDVLRGEWGFDGFTVSDYKAISELAELHGVAESEEDAMRQAINAGVEVELPDRDATNTLTRLVEKGLVSLDTIDEAVRNVLRGKFVAGLFEDPFADEDQAEETTGADEARRVALRAAERSIILLKNEEGVLPLSLSGSQRIAVIGPNASDTILGGYSDTPKQTISVLEGLRTRVPEDIEVVYAEGCRITEGRNWWADEVRLADADANRQRIVRAVEVAESADVAVLALGENEHTAREAWSSTHLGDRSDLGLVGEQSELVRAVHAVGKPTIVLFIGGRPLATPWIAEHVPAIVQCWCLGQETGTAVARVLFGDVNPGGKLPLSIPRSVGQLPIYYNHKPTARRGYLFGSTDPLFPFGHGLSYTTFEVGVPELDSPTASCGESVRVRVPVRNVGTRDGEEVVQVYLRDRVASVTRPVKQLVAFQRVAVAAGETRTVELTLPPSSFALYDRELRHVIEPGEFDVLVGPDLTHLRATTLRIVGDPTVVNPLRREDTELEKSRLFE